MIDNEEKKCHCDNIIKDGIYEKCFEDEKITIYGHLIKENSILIKYHNILSDLPTHSVFAIFDNNEEEKELLNFTRCAHGKENDFCYTLELNELDNICFEYYKDDVMSFHSFKIQDDPFKNIIKRYHLEEQVTLPMVNNKESFDQKIRDYFVNIVINIKRLFKHTK